MPRRMANGVEVNRVALLLAVMEKRLGQHLSGQDVFINVIGGMQLDEPAIDLGIVAAVTSSLREKPIDAATLILGEIGLGGEVRAVGHAEMRVREAAKLGFRRCILPDRNRQKLDPIDGIELIGVSDVREALDAVLR
jgi:DNA repair protein RadA/Sms